MIRARRSATRTRQTPAPVPSRTPPPVFLGHSPAEIEDAAPGFMYPSTSGGDQYSQSLAAMAATVDTHFEPTRKPSSFGPGVPASITPLDDTGEPRQYQYRQGWNLPALPGEGRPLDMSSLRALADVYDILRKCIEVRKDELCSMSFGVIARETDRRKARQVVQDQQSTIREIETFLMFPDRKHTWQTWLRMLLEDYFVVDAASIWKHRDYGGRLIGLRVLDGALIKPMLSINGDTPDPPDTAYQQYVWGLPRWNFSAEELLYCPKNVRPNRAYGFSPVEQFLTHVTLSLRYQRFQLDFFTDGTVPEGVAEAPASWSPKQLQDFNAIWDRMLAGDSRALHKLRFVPAGFKFHQFKEHTFNSEFARWLVGVTCAAFDLQPQELGFEPMHGGLGGRGFSEEQSIILKRKAIYPLQRWLLDEIINPIIWEEFGATDLQGTFIDEGSSREQLQQMQARDLAIRNGTMSIDEAVEEDGGEPPGIDRIFVVGNLVYGAPDLLALSTVGAAALNISGTPPPEGSRPVPLGMTAAEQSSIKSGINLMPGGNRDVPALPPKPGSESADGKEAQSQVKPSAATAPATPPQPAKPEPPTSPSPPAEGKDVTVPSHIILDPTEAHKAAVVQVQSQQAQAQLASRRNERSSNPDPTQQRRVRAIAGPGEVADPDLTKAAIADELGKYSRFVAARRRRGSWRPFQSSILDPEVVRALNTAGEESFSAA